MVRGGWQNEEIVRRSQRDTREQQEPQEHREAAVCMDACMHARFGHERRQRLVCSGWIDNYNYSDGSERQRRMTLRQRGGWVTKAGCRRVFKTPFRGCGL